MVLTDDDSAEQEQTAEKSWKQQWDVSKRATVVICMYQQHGINEAFLI